MKALIPILLLAMLTGCASSRQDWWDEMRYGGGGVVIRHDKSK